MSTSLADLRLHGSGKVREIYEDGDELIMVASDRISVYDVILPTEIPDKGRVTSYPRTSPRKRPAAGCG
jgi:phosphoribosylaminoimidazole-succinocarboxamide synthase